MSRKTPPPSPATKPLTVVHDATEGTMKDLGGAGSDHWNQRLLGQLAAAVPDWPVLEQQHGIVQALAGGQLGIKPTDPVEAMLSAQMIAANTAALALYQRAWIPEQSFEVRTKYLALADKAARTVAVLAEALDRHRGRGQQQITVKHVTVNADQAVVADQVVTNGKPVMGGGGGGEQ